jgi:uncharacterized protein YndB with AHSA1/START domain
MEPKFEVQLKIRKTVHEVFEAVVDPKKLSGYFTKTASGRLAEGTTVVWSFPEFPGEFPVKVREVVPDKLIVLHWESQEGGYDTKVEMSFKPLDDGNMMVAGPRVGLARHAEGDRELLRQLRGLDAHGLWPQGLPGVRHQPQRGWRTLNTRAHSRLASQVHEAVQAVLRLGPSSEECDPDLAVRASSPPLRAGLHPAEEGEGLVFGGLDLHLAPDDRRTRPGPTVKVVPREKRRLEGLRYQNGTTLSPCRCPSL